MKVMTPKRLLLVLLFSIFFLVGVLAGAVIQKTIGVGNVLRAVGIPYPTSVPPGDPYVLSTVEIPQAYRGQMSLFILAGQSNMVGWAPVPEEEKTDPRIYVFSNDYRWRVAGEPIDHAFNQVDKISEDRNAAFGPSLAFALASLDRHPEVVIGLIPCAKDSTGIVQWQRNLSDQSLYGSCLKRARAASTMGRVAGVLFFQGETDALDPALYPRPEPQAFDWAPLFTAFITDLRNDLHKSELPVVFAQLGPEPLSKDFPNWDVVKEQQSSIDLPMTAMITTDDLPLLDGLHFTADSYRTIGRRFANAYWDLAKQVPVQ
jgi:Carbohydrate esterase, sialic acid-specific acetylesterase